MSLARQSKNSWNMLKIQLLIRTSATSGFFFFFNLSCQKDCILSDVTLIYLVWNIDLSGLDINSHSFLMHCTMLTSPCRDSDTTPKFLAVHFESEHCDPEFHFLLLKHTNGRCLLHTIESSWGILKPVTKFKAGIRRDPWIAPRLGLILLLWPHFHQNSSWASSGPTFEQVFLFWQM